MRALAAAMAVAMAASPALADENPLFFQATVATQAHPSFHAPYSGMNSLHPEAESALSVVMDLGARIHPWIGAEIVVQPELAGGRGLSSTLGVAAYPSGEVYRIGNPEPALILAKLSLRQAAGEEIARRATALITKPAEVLVTAPTAKAHNASPRMKVLYGKAEAASIGSRRISNVRYVGAARTSSTKKPRPSTEVDPNQT